LAFVRLVAGWLGPDGAFSRLLLGGRVVSRSDRDPFTSVSETNHGGDNNFMSAGPTNAVRRCTWAVGDPLLLAYHDTEWGVPEYDSRALWEKLMLDGFQAGLSWSIILRKRDAFRKAFKNFNPEKVARFGEAEIARLLADAGIVRSRAKIEATIGGARAYLAMKDAGEDLSDLVWGMAGGKPIQNRG
jgi:DNA-3-methyladenine glycosylase I